MLGKLFFGNTVESWAIAIAILLAAAILGRVASSIVKSMATRLGSPLIAVMVAGASAPLTLFVCLFGVRVAAESLVLSAGVHNWRDLLFGGDNHMDYRQYLRCGS